MKRAPDDPRRRWFLTEGTVLGALAQGGNVIHAGVVRPFPQVRGYSMTPLCSAYRKRNGEQLARHREHGWPMLVRHLGYLWRDYLHGAVPTYRARLCRHCAAVWTANAEQAADLELAVVDIPDSPQGLS